MADGSLFQVGENVEFWRVLVHLSILAFCLVLFEKALHRMEHKFPASDKYQHMLKKVYRELMVLGLISLGLKILKENPDIDSYSKPMLAFQVADLTIFFLALALILQSTAVFLLLRNQNDRADRAELMRTVDLVELVNSTENAKDAMPSFVRTLLCCGRESKKKTYVKKLVELRLLRRLFLRRFGFPQLFPFAKYLSRAQANQISHMIEVEPSMWVVLLAVAWGICGLLKLLEALDADMPERQELVEAFMIVAWILLLLHLMVFLYFRSCVHYLLRLAAINDDKTILTANLQAIAEEEAKAWQNEEADKALEIMSSIQEQHEEFEYERVRRKKKLARQDGGHLGAALCGLSSDHSNNLKGCESISGVAPGSPNIDIQFFSYKAWHVSVILLLVLNGFFITLFLQCAVYDLDEIYEDFGTLPALLVPLPLVLNALFFQRHIFYDFVIVSSTLRIDSQTLSSVVETFSEVVRLRSEFAASLHQHLNHQELTIADLREELKARDVTGSGLIEADELRSVLGKFGFRLTRFRFNSVVKMLFETEGTSVAYSQVVRLVAMAENEYLVENGQAAEYPAHPLLRPSVLVYDSVGQTSVLSQSNYNLYASTRRLQQAQSSMREEPLSDHFINVPAGSFVLPPVSQCGVNPNATAVQQPVMPRPSVSSQALHDMFNLERLSDSRARSNTRDL
ncbi:Ufm1-specific protease [Phytophthora cinnamomi]|uniref:Ufm1-specific protease n=1 Tax=Phytophthora cinnamomi TaxID=4785 RepID=UPI003559B773|nr:Ufm1-specific protease [Phytophthora cinnamomi]